MHFPRTSVFVTGAALVALYVGANGQVLAGPSTAAPLMTTLRQPQLQRTAARSRLRSLNAMTVLPSTSHFALAYVVNGPTKSYFFPPNTMITRLGNTVFVRAYNSLWPFSTSNISIRQLSSTTNLNLGGLHQETNSAMASAVTTAASHRVAIPNDKCPDCITPVAGYFLSSNTFGPQPHPTLPAGISTKHGSGDGPDMIAGQVPRQGPPTPMPQSQMQTQNSPACFPSGWIVLTHFGECVAPSSQSSVNASRPAVWPPRFSLQHGAQPFAILSGTATNYWFDWLASTTTLYGTTPANYYGYLYWEAFYFDDLGSYGYGAGEWAVVSGGNFEIQVSPTYTNGSETQVYFYDTTFNYLGWAQGIYADFV